MITLIPGGLHDITVIRISNFIIWMKEAGLRRSDARNIWVLTKSPGENIEKRKQIFNEIW